MGAPVHIWAAARAHAHTTRVSPLSARRRGHVRFACRPLGGSSRHLVLASHAERAAPSHAHARVRASTLGAAPSPSCARAAHGDPSGGAQLLPHAADRGEELPPPAVRSGARPTQGGRRLEQQHATHASGGRGLGAPGAGDGAEPATPRAPHDRAGGGIITSQ